MKILRIRTKNLNSLKGVNEIDFTKSPFIETGIFAITGETGAGKTTILDALTLGLYGKTSREHQNEVMTYGTGECYAEVEFEVKKEQYRAKWSRRRARNKPDGNLQTPAFEIAALPSGKPLCRNLKNLVLSKIEELIGLGYEQFRRSVMLAQGDFAAFLKANERERSALLERITGTQIYTDISKAAFERYKLENNKLEQLQFQLRSLQLLSAEEEALIQTELKEAIAQNEELKKGIKTLEEQQQWLRDIEKRQRQLGQLQLSLEQLQRVKDDFAPKKAKLDLHQTAIPFQKNLATLDFIKNEVKRLSIAIQKSRAKIDELNKKQKNKEELRDKAKENWMAIAEQRPAKEALFEEVIKLDTQIKAEEKPLAEKELQLQKIEKLLTKNKKTVQKQEKQLGDLEQSIDNLTNWIEQNTLDQNIQTELIEIKQHQKEQKTAEQQEQKLDKLLKNTIEQYESTADNLKEQKNEERVINSDLIALNRSFERELHKQPTGNHSQDLEYFDADIKEIEKQQQQISDFLAELKVQELKKQELEKVMQELTTCDDDWSDKKKELKRLISQLEQAELTHQDKRKIYKLELQIKNYEAERKQLVQGEPCPLCLSKEHAAHDYEPNVSIAEQEKNEAETHLQETKVKKAKTEERLKVIEQQIESLESKQNEYLEDINDIEEAVEYLPQFVKSIYYNGKKQGLEQKQVQLEEILEAMNRTYQSLKQTNRQIQEKNKQLNDLQIHLSSLKEKVTNLKQEKGRISSDLDGIRTNLTSTTTALGNILEKYQLLHTDKKAVKKLENRSVTYQKNIEKLRQNQQQKALVTQSIESLKRAIVEQKTTIQEEQKVIKVLHTSLANLKGKRFEQFGNQIPEFVRATFRKELKQKEEVLKKAEAALQEVQSQLSNESTLLTSSIEEIKVKQADSHLQEVALIAQLMANGFESIDALKNALLSDKEANQLQHAYQEIENNIIQQRATIDATNEELTTLLALEKTTVNQEAIQVALTEKVDEQADVAEKIGRLKEQLEHNDLQKIKAKDRLTAIDTQQKETNRWAKLNDIIGQADGKKFRAFAQGLTLQKLVQLANQHLENLSGRYHIEKQKGHDLTLAIIDHYQGDHSRSMSTLSGGESFLVSLALALGLSALAGRDTQIQSLFIDEGFGTLDGQTLDVAIETLENLQAQGKTIGVISHVHELKERIATQVQVRRIGQGVSQVEIRA